LDLANRHGVEMPITEQVVNVIHNGTSAEKVLKAFMSRPTTAEEGQEQMEHM
jgi:glycerol-3-phosphate dehydrogenase (NAD(P)+)